MRIVIPFALVTVACTPEIVPGSYYCGPNASCPEDQRCNELDNKCVLSGLVQPFACESQTPEPDDAPENAYEIMVENCTPLPVSVDSCMPEDDTADWLKFTPPANCGPLQVDARITFPVAFQRLSLEIVDMASGDTLATDDECAFQGESGDDLRCALAPVTAGNTYGLRIAPTGEGDCDGDCRFNSYTVRFQVDVPD